MPRTSETTLQPLRSCVPATTGRGAAMVSFAALALSALGTTGCAVSRLEPGSVTSATQAVHLTGKVHGGQQPISGATLQLYAAGSAGNGSAATPLLTAAVQTDSAGGFDITGDYTCPSASAQVYLAATGGNPGLPSGTSNQAISLVVALGDCGAVPGMAYVSIDERSTAAAAWALAPFGSATAAIGASATNLAGLQTAMRTAGMLVDPASGALPSATLPAGVTAETAKVTTLGNILAGCVNSDGGAMCSSLFADVTPAGGTAPTDTFSAALLVAANPGNNVAAIYNHMPPQPAFGGALAQAPADWTLSLGVSGGGMQSPTAVGVDGAGNVWVASNEGVVSAFSPQGTPLWASGIGGSGLSHTVSLAVDAASNIWVSNQDSGSGNGGAGSVTEVSSAGSMLSGANGYTAGNINFPGAIATDPNGTVWVANLGTSTVSLLASDGTPLSGTAGFGAGTLASPSALAVDAGHAAWITSHDTGMLTRMDANGNVLQQINCCGLPDSLALDSAGNVWVGDNTHSQLTEVQPNGVVLLTAVAGGGLNRPTALVADAGDHLWTTDSIGNTLSEFAGTNSGILPGTALSPAAGLGADAALQVPFSAAVDASGTVWVSSFADGRLVGFVGLGTPTRTPRGTLPVAP